MATIRERAKAYADRHELAEMELRGLGGVYGYSRIYNSEMLSYEKGATEQKAVDIETIPRLYVRWLLIDGDKPSWEEYANKALEG